MNLRNKENANYSFEQHVLDNYSGVQKVMIYKLFFFDVIPTITFFALNINKNKDKINKWKKKIECRNNTNKRAWSF